MTGGDAILSVRDLSIATASRGGRAARIVDDVSLSLRPGQSLGIAGESGSGKSTLLLSMMGILRQGLRHEAGEVILDGTAMLGRADAELEHLRGGRIGLIPQNASTAMTPTLTVGAQIDEALRLHSGLEATAIAGRRQELLDRVRLPDPARLAARYPHELSGGQVQRAAVAMALAGDPAVLLLDEPTTGLDVTTQLAILDLLLDLQRSSGVAMVCVSHDLGVLAHLCQSVAVMYAGAMVEEQPVRSLIDRPAHPYAADLLASLPKLSHPGLPRAIAGAPPDPHALPPGCRYAPSCRMAAEDCRSARPPLVARGDNVRVACFHPLGTATDAAPRVEGAAPPADDATALEIVGLSVSYARRNLLQRWFGGVPGQRAVVDVSLTVRRGEVLGLVGESGSGKSTILRAISGLRVPMAGLVALGGGSGREQVLRPGVTARPLAQLRAVQLVFQNPDASLNPRQRVIDILAQPIRLYGTAGANGLRARAAALLAEVRLGDGHLDRYPSQLSGGERQRVAIARAFAANPDVLLCDEITTALDVSVQAAVLGLVRDLARKERVATVFVSHDLAVVRAIADRIAVLYAGRLIELGPADRVCDAPAHPYTRALLAAALEVDGDRPPVASLPDRSAIPARGCPFAPRCAVRIPVCETALPGLYGGDHQARCVHAELADDRARA